MIHLKLKENAKCKDATWQIERASQELNKKAMFFMMTHVDVSVQGSSPFRSHLG